MRSQFNRKLGRFMLATGRKVYPLISAFYNLLLLPVLLVACLAKLLLGVPLNQPVFDDDEDVKKAWHDKRWGKHGFIKANGINFHYVESGPKDAPLMLFLHGFPECWYSWREQLHTIGKTGQYHCVAIDLRGYGLTDKPQGIHNYSIETLVADVEGVIDAFVTKHNKREKKAAVVAHDWGGWLAWHAGHMIPHKMSSLCIMNSPHPLLFERNSSITQFFRFWYMYFFQLPYISELILSSFGYWGIGFAFTGPITGVKDRTHMTETDVKVFKYAFSRPNGPSAVLNYFRNSVRKSPEDIAKTLCRPIPSDLPLVVLWGQFDGALGRELIDEDLDVVVRPKLAPTFFDASHWLQHERPHEVNAHLLAFLAEHGLASVESMAGVDESDDKAASDIVNVITAETEPVGSDEKLLADPDAGGDLPPPSLADISKMFKSEADAP